MDLKLMIKEMIQSGMSDADILQSLRELGVENVEEVLKRAVEEERREAANRPGLKPATEQKARGMKEISLQPDLQKEVEKGGGERKEESGKESGEGSEEAADELGQPLFGKEGGLHEQEEKEEVLEGRDLFGGAPKKPGQEERRGEEPAAKDLGLPELEITNVTREGEKAKSLEEMLGKQLMEKPPETTLQNVEEVERKLDETIALLKSLQQINQKILEANREMLLKLKMQK